VGHQFAEALHTAEDLDLEPFRTMQNHYNLTYREEEREMLPLCEKEDVAVIPWSPLAGGYLTRPDDAAHDTERGSDADWEGHRSNGGREINERVEELAAEKGLTMAQISLAWLLHKEWVTAPIVGTTSVEHLEDAVEALEVDLSDSEMEYLEEPYGAKAIQGH